MSKKQTKRESRHILRNFFARLRTRARVARLRLGKRLANAFASKWLKRLVITLLALALIGAGGVYAWGRLTDNTDFEIAFYQLNDDKITGNVRAAFLSDLHLSEFGKDNIELVSAIERLRPDIILIGGDMNVSGNPDYAAVLTLVEQLTPIAGVYYALGNHEYNDYLFADSRLLSDVRALGATVLSNHYVTVNVNGNLIDIGGLNEMSNHFHQESAQEFYESYMRSQNYRLLLAHDPAYFIGEGALKGADIDMALCGHRHGGQIVIPFLGGLYHPGSGILPELTDGALYISGAWVVVSRGLGNSGGIPRVNNPPQLVIIDIY